MVYSYYVTFTDDHSRKTLIYFLKTKESKEVLSEFKEFKAQVKNLAEKRIKILRSDNGGEYTYTEFNYFFKEEGIKRELTILYNPQQNGVAETKNRIVVEATKAMIHDQSLPMFLWAKASRTIVYVQNLEEHESGRSFHRSEARSGPPSYLWLSSVHTYAQGQKVEIGAFGKEGDFHGI